MWERQESLVNLQILEIGAGTSLPGILAAKLGANVTLSDCATLPKTLAHIERACSLNGLKADQDIKIVGLSWGLLLDSIFTLGPLDLIIGSDCFYDPSVFEDVLVTISFLLEKNPNARFIFTYQERSSDWTFQSLLRKYSLECVNISLDSIGRRSGININRDFLQGQVIYLLEITLKR